MPFVPSFLISSSGLSVQKTKMDLASTNLANAQTTRAADGKTYRRAVGVFSAVPLGFETELQSQMGIELEKVQLAEVTRDPSPLKNVYDPSHPDANAQGFVQLPNVNVMQEMSELLLASRAYEANVTAFNTSKAMALKLLDIGKV